MKKLTNITHPAFALFTLACFALAPQARATCQEGCLTNQNTVLGDDALLNNIGSNNTAVGFNALYSNTIGELNTAAGYRALYSNTDAIGMTAFGFQRFVPTPVAYLTQRSVSMHCISIPSAS